MNVSIIIRVKNEKENLDKLIKILKEQTFQDFEVVIVNNNSSDGSDKVPYDYFPKERIQIANIDRFTYSKACNEGVRKARGKFIVFLSAHAYPMTKTWLEDGLKDFNDNKVAAVFAFPVAGSDGGVWEKISSIPNYIKRGGYMGNTDSIIRRNLWEEHKFDEELINGSEDYEWSLYWSKEGWKIVNDPKFRVYHSHGLSLTEILKQHKMWSKQKKEINNKFLIR